MIPEFNPQSKNVNDLNLIISNLGSFYNLMDYKSKENLKIFFNSLLVSMEGLYYNALEAVESFNINTVLPYIDLSFSELFLDLQDADIIKVEPPAAITYTVLGTSGTEIYNYTVTSVDSFGTETPYYKIIAVDGGNDNLNTTDKIRLEWPLVDGAVSYKIYGRDTNNLGLIGTSVTNLFEDTGQTLSPGIIPNFNNTVRGYKFKLPFDYKIFNITKIGDMEQSTDFVIENFDTIFIKNITAFTNRKKYLLKGVYAFVPILTNLYLPEYVSHNNYLKILTDKSYLGYLNETYLNGDTTEDKINRIWAFHLMKLFHKLSLLSRSFLSMSGLKYMYSLIYNVPFAYAEGTLTNITQDSLFTYFKIGDYYYKIPKPLSLLKSSGSAIQKYELLVQGVEIEDAYSENTSVQITDSFNANRRIKFIIPENIEDLGSNSIFINNFLNNILPKNFEVIS